MIPQDFRNVQLDDQWVVAIQDEIDAMPVDDSEYMPPEEVGRMDALNGVCDPVKHYTKLGQIEAYLVGWNDAVAALADDVEFVSDAYAHGKQDYNEGLPCGTFRFYECRGHRQDYVYGYRDAKIAATTPKAARLLTEDEMQAELEDLREDIADRQWFSRGQW